MNSVGHKGISTKCCYCGRIKANDRWTHSVEPAETLFSHGCCPLCEEQMMAEMDFVEEIPSARVRTDAAIARPGHARRPFRISVADAAV